MIETTSDKELLLAFCDARIDKENALLMHMGIVIIVANVQKLFIKPKYVHSIYQKNRIAGSVSEAPFYELFSVAEGVANLARIKEEVQAAIVCNDCSGTVDLLARVNRPSIEVPFKHQSLYLASIGASYHQHIGFHWLRRNNPGMKLADFISRCSSVEDVVHLPLSEKYESLKRELLGTAFPLSLLDSIPNK